MSNGGIFLIITNDGKQDKILLATDMLNQRLLAINKQKLAMGAQPNSIDALPTLSDIEKTHMLFVNAHFKPFAAIGFEYNKVRSNSGVSQFGQSVQFSIPQFGDFFNDIAVHAVLTQPTTVTAGTTGTSNEPLVRWASYPGERLLKKVKFEVNGNPLDEYSYHATNFHREFHVAPGKLLAWKRCVGEDDPEWGYVDQPNWVSNGVAASSVNHRLLQQVDTTNQCPTGVAVKAAASALELFIPLLFWFNMDVRLAVPSVAIPYGQRFITIDLADEADMVNCVPRGSSTWGADTCGSVTISTFELYINNIFMNPEVHAIYIKRIGFSLIRVHREQLSPQSVANASVWLNQLKWPVEYLHLGMKIKNYYAGSTAALKAQSLDRWYLFSKLTDTTYRTTGQNVDYTSALNISTSAATIAYTTATGAVALSAASPITVAVGDVLVQNASGLRFPVITVTNQTTLVCQAAVTLANIAAEAQTGWSLVRSQGLQVTGQKIEPTLSTVALNAQGVSLYPVFPADFYSDYLVYNYGGLNISTPERKGACLVPFCLYPGTYQPSGHLNVSRAREFYCDYTSSVIDGSTEGTLVVVASCINFLLISDGSAVLRYST